MSSKSTHLFANPKTLKPCTDTKRTTRSQENAWITYILEQPNRLTRVPLIQSGVKIFEKGIQHNRGRGRGGYTNTVTISIIVIQTTYEYIKQLSMNVSIYIHYSRTV